MTGRGPRAPRAVDISSGALSDGDADDVGDDADIDGLRFTDLSTGSLSLTDSRVLGCSFSRTRTPELDAQRATIRGSRFTQSDVVTLRGWRGRWNDVQFDGGRFGVVETYDAKWGSVEFLNCKAAYVNLRAADLSDVVFDGCDIEELDLTDATVRRMALPGTRVRRLNLQGATLQDVDLRGAAYDSVVDLSSMRGATISDAQLGELAPAIAEHLGIRVSG